MWRRERKRCLLLVERKSAVFEGDQCSFWHESNDRARPTTKTSPSLSHQLQEEEVRREKGASEAGVRLGRLINSRAKTFRKVLALKYIVSICILPNVISPSLNRDVNSAQSAHSRTGRLKKNQTKAEKKVTTKVQLLL